MSETVTLDQVLEVQGDEWARGGRPLVEELLRRFPDSSGDAETTKWLLVGEIILRRDREPKSALAVEIERRFPSLVKEVWEYLEFSDSCGLPAVEHKVAENAVPIKTPGANSEHSDFRETTCIVANLLAANDLALTTPRNAQDPTDLKPDSETSGANRPRLPRIADYFLLREIGRGGFGKVFLGKNAHDGSYAAVKVLGRGSGIEIAGVSQFKRSGGGHPHLVPILHMGKVTKFVYYTMPLADAYRPDQSDSGTPTTPPTNALSEEYRPHTLELEIAQRGKLTVEESLDLLRQLLSALERLHRNQIVHCDVKPANILRIDGVWKLGDMGLAIKSSSEREATGARGTRAYWPPEGPRGDSTDDLFALGLTIWVASTGKPTREFFVDATGKTARSKITDREHERLLRCVDRLCRTGSQPPFADATSALAQLPMSRPMRRQARMRAMLVIAMGLMVTVGAAAVWIAVQNPKNVVVEKETENNGDPKHTGFQPQDLWNLEKDLVELRNLAASGDWPELIEKNGNIPPSFFEEVKNE
ncbi:MAG: serine/threonine-protein kinase, partial [Planctomycetota bacterium]|nr:serine/threonine-protein kinase [Planctomycetota bacterium]